MVDSRVIEEGEKDLMDILMKEREKVEVGADRAFL
jgi:hypothetical protein